MHFYGLIIGLALIITLRYFETHQNLIPKPRLALFELGLLLSALIGARLYHVADYWHYYSQNLVLIPQTWLGGLGIFGALLGALIFICFYSCLYRLSFIGLLDSFAPILPLAQTIGRFGNWVNGENPLWWPEAIGNFLLFLLIKKYPQKPTAKYLIGYGLIRFITEYFRYDTWTVNSLKISQLLSFIFILIGLMLHYQPCHRK